MKVFLALLTAIFILFSSCTDNDNQLDDQMKTIEDGIVINNNSDDLSSRVTAVNDLVIVNDLPASTLKAANLRASTDTLEIDYTQNYAFTLRAEVEAPQVDGQYVQSTHVKIVDDMAFVSYNTKGDIYSGGVELFDISDPTTPVLSSQALFSNMDVSSVEYYNGVIYLVGALDPESVDYALESPAILITLEMSNAEQIMSVSHAVDLPSYVATDVEVDVDYVYVTSGSAGSLTILNRSDLSVAKDIPMEDVRSLSINTNAIYVLSSDQYIHPFTKTDFTETEKIAMDGPVSAESKTEIDATDKYILAALNESGLDIRNLDGSSKERFARPETAENGLDEDYVTNSVCLNEELLLIGNGAAGIYVGAMVPENDDDVTLLGSMEFGSSVNFVESQGNYIFVAAGTAGLKILTVAIDEGLPEQIISTTPCEDLKSNVFNLLFYSKNNTLIHPDLFSDESNLMLRLIKESPIYLTFIDESASWKNSLAYYTYESGDAPASADDIELHMLFPNTSKVGSGGGLNPGDRVQLGSLPFPANTVIGFCLIARGWKNGTTVDGAYRHYTNMEWNENTGEKQQHVLFKEQTCGDIVLSFEDIRLPSGDLDFNDLIFTVNDNEEDNNSVEAFDLTNIIEK